MSNEEIKVTDAEALEWASKLSESDKAELKRQALLKRALELAQPEKATDFGSLTDEQLEDFKRRNGFYK